MERIKNEERKVCETRPIRIIARAIHFTPPLTLIHSAFYHMLLIPAWCRLQRMVRINEQEVERIRKEEREVGDDLSRTHLLGTLALTCLR